MAKNKITVDLTANPDELDDALKDSEGLITRYGKKIESVFQKMGSTIQYSLSTAAHTVSSAVSGFGNLFNSLLDVSKAIGLVNTSASSFNNIFDNGIVVIKEFISNLNYTWQLQKDLALTVKMTGTAANQTSKDMEVYAEYLEKVTGYSKEVTIGTEQIIAHFRDIRGKNFFEATKAAQDMATALHIDLSTAAREVGNALQNPIEAFEELEQKNILFTKAEKKNILTLLEANKVSEAQEKILKKLKDSFGGAAQNEMSSFLSKMQQLKNRLYTVAQTITEHVIKAFNKLFGTTKDNRSMIEAYMTYIESHIPTINAWIDAAIKKMQEWRFVIEQKLVKAFNYFVEIAITGVTVIQTAFQNLNKIVRIVIANFELQLEKLKQNWLVVWTQVIPASIRWVERIFKEVTEVKIPNFFTRMLQKILTIMTKGFVKGVIKLLEFASGIWITVLGVKMSFMGARVMLKFIKAAIEAPLKMGGVAGKVFRTLFGLPLKGIEALGAHIGTKLAENETAEREELGRHYKNNFGTDAIENFWKTMLPERAERTSMEAPDFVGMFTKRQETDKEKGLREEIEKLKEEIKNDFPGNREENSEKIKNKISELKDKIGKYLEEKNRADANFKDNFAKGHKEPDLINVEKAIYDRKEAEAAKQRAEEEELRAREEELSNARQNAKQNNEDKKIHQGVSGLEEFWRKQSSELDNNTRALKESTKNIKENTSILKGDIEVNKDGIGIIADIQKTEEDILEEHKRADFRKKYHRDVQDRGSNAPGFSAFIMRIPTGPNAQKIIERQQKQKEAADKKEARNKDIRYRNQKILLGRKAKKSAIPEYRKFGNWTEQQQKQQRMIDAQIKQRDDNKKQREEQQKIIEDNKKAAKERANSTKEQIKKNKENHEKSKKSFEQQMEQQIRASHGIEENTKQTVKNTKKKFNVLS